MAIKQINVSFQYDTETDLVSNVSTIVDGIKQAKKTTTKKKDLETPMVLENEAIVTLDDSRLLFNNLAIQTLGIDSESKVVIKYKKDEKTKKAFPLIGKDSDFDEEGTGNKITQPKSGEYKGKTTMLYKGKNNTFLAEYGNEFRLEEFEPGIFKLIGSKEPAPKMAATKLEDVNNASDDTDVSLITEGDDTQEIDSFTFTL